MTPEHGPHHWHVYDHYSGASRRYRERGPAMRAWIRRHGGVPIVEVLFCDALEHLVEAEVAEARDQ